MNTEALQRVTIDGVGRLYNDPKQDLWLPSVSTVLDVRPTPEALKQWKERVDNYDELMSWYQNRGTLLHAECLSQLTPKDPDTDEPIVEIWGKDEQESEDELKDSDKWDEYERDREWALEAWEVVKMVSNIDTVLDCETFIFETDIGYAGQFDLLYHDNEANETVLADLKTSKNVYDKHQIQLAAYAMAVPITVDRLEVIRINPDRRDWEVSSSHTWAVDRRDLENEFIELRAKLEREKLETIEETILNADEDEEGVMFEKPGE